GVGFVPGTPGGVNTYLSDNFNRTAADLLGSTPQTGTAWYGASGDTGTWGIDGAAAVKNATGAGGARSDLGVAGDVTLTATGITPSTIGDTANREFNLRIKAPSSANVDTGLVARIQVAATTGAVAWHLIKREAGVATVLATGMANPIAANTASVTFTQ